MFWAWINSTGRNFVQPPVPGESNYLSDYRRDGERKTAPRRARSGPRSQSLPEGETVDSRALADAAIEDNSRAVDAQEVYRSKIPFPMNHHFYSTPILSEALRLEVWKRVQVEGQSVRQVSADLNIDMRRVGAVVRLVEVEKRMRAEVCSPKVFSPSFHDAYTISLSDFQPWCLKLQITTL